MIAEVEYCEGISSILQRAAVIRSLILLLLEFLDIAFVF